MDAQTIHRRRWWILAVLNVSLLMTIMDNTILNVALPTLARDLGARSGQLQWIVDSYVLVFAGLLLLAGALGDRFGRRGAFSAGLVIFGLASLGATFAGSAGELIAARSVMGAGAALIMPATLSILTNVFTDPIERAKAIGSWASVGGVGVALGPTLGGWLLRHFSWSSIFMLNIPTVLVLLVAGVLLVPTSRDPEEAPLDVIGCVLSIFGLGALVWSIIEGGEAGWTQSTTLMGFALAVIALVAFAAWEIATAKPMLDLSFFRNRRFTAASVSVMLGYFAMFGTLFLLSQVLQFVLGYDSFEAGIRVLPFALSMVVFSPISVKLVERLGTKVVVTVGLSMVAAGLLWLAPVGPASTYGHYLVAMLVMGSGVALTWAPTTEAIMGSLPPSKAGVGSAINDTVREVGGALGVAVLGSLVASEFGSKMETTTASLPASAREAARESLGGAIVVAEQLSGPQGQAVLAAGRRAFLDGFGLAVSVGAVIATAAAVLAAKWLPSRVAPADMTEEATSDADQPALEPAAA